MFTFVDAKIDEKINQEGNLVVWCDSIELLQAHDIIFLLVYTLVYVGTLQRKKNKNCSR